MLHKRIAAIGIVAVLWPSHVLTHDTESTTTTVFDREVVRILSHRCVSCHSDGNLAVPLTTYEQAYVHARAIKTEVQQRHMPPWSATAGYGHYSNDNGLTAREIDFLVSWADGGKPRNAGTVFLNVPDPATARREVRAEDGGALWRIGNPGLTRRLAPQTVPAHNPLTRRLTVDLGLTAERWVQALEYQPGDRRVVRSAVFTLEQTGQWLGTWTPWAHATALPSRMAYRLPSGSRIVADIQYQGTAEDVMDEGTIGLSFGDKPLQTCEGDVALTATADAGTGAGAPERILRAETMLKEDTWVKALMPDVPANITSVQVSARRPDGGIDVLLFARDLRPDWPTPYIFKAPVVIRKGTRLSTVMHSTVAGATPATAARLIVSRCG